MQLLTFLRALNKRVTEPLLATAYTISISGLPADIRNRIAAHEAGHAFAAWYSPIVTRFVRSTISSDATGLTWYEGPHKPDPLAIWELASIRMSGAAAEKILLGNVAPCGTGPDIAGTVSLLRSLRNHELAAPPWKDVEAFTSAKNERRPWLHHYETTSERGSLDMLFSRACNVLMTDHAGLRRLHQRLRKNGVITAVTLHDLLGKKRSS